jgi:hypothetical protein
MYDPPLVVRFQLEELSKLLGDPRIASVQANDLLFLDIEATQMFHGAGNCAFMIGVAWFRTDGALVIQQILQRDPADELAALSYFAQLVEEHPTIVSFNGKSYDLTVLQNRLIIQKIYDPSQASIKVQPHIDLYHISRRLFGGIWSDCKLQTLEQNVLGLSRTNDLPGSMAPDRYHKYLYDRRAEGLIPVFEHNLLDVYSLAMMLCWLNDALHRPEDHLEPRACVRLGTWYVAQKRRRSESILRTALEGELESSTRILAYRNLIKALRQNQQRENMLPLLLRYQKECPFHHDPWTELSKWYEHRTRDFEKALHAAQEALLRAPWHDRCLRSDLNQRQKRLIRRLSYNTAD